MALGELRINPAQRTKTCRCGKPYIVREVQRTVSDKTDEVLTRRLDVYLCGCGDTWVDNINNEPEPQN